MGMTAAESRHIGIVVSLGCIICGEAAEAHHPRTGAGMARKSPHCDVISLCPAHHRTGGYGVALHAGQQIFEERYGTEAELLEQVRAELGLRPGELAR
jgi:hypothetical protein